MTDVKNPLTDDQSDQQDPSTNTQQTSSEDHLFIGEGRKYKDVAEADKAIAFKDSHISKIEQENADLRKAMESASTVSDILETMKNTNQQQGQGQDTSTEDTDKDTQQIDIDSLISERVNNALSASKQKETAQANMDKVVGQLQSRYGDKAKDVYLAKEKELGISLQELAVKSPTAALELFKEATSAQMNTSSYRGDVNSNNFSGQSGAQARTYDYWKKQLDAGKISREQCYREQHKSLSELGPEAFYQS